MQGHVTVREAADRLGITPRILYRLIDDGVLPAVKATVDPPEHVARFLAERFGEVDAAARASRWSQIWMAETDVERLAGTSAVADAVERAARDSTNWVLAYVARAQLRDDLPNATRNAQIALAASVGATAGEIALVTGLDVAAVERIVNAT
jgi:hypothetical protein